MDAIHTLDIDRRAEISRFVNRLQCVKRRELRLIDFVEFAFHRVPDTGLVQHHRREPRLAISIR